MSSIESEQDIDKRLEAIADKILDMKLEAPCCFLLEAHIPFASVIHTGSLLVAPLTAPVVGLERINLITELFSRRDNVERLVEIIRLKSEGKTL